MNRYRADYPVTELLHAPQVFWQFLSTLGRLQRPLASLFWHQLVGRMSTQGAGGGGAWFEHIMGPVYR